MNAPCDICRMNNQPNCGYDHCPTNDGSLGKTLELQDTTSVEIKKLSIGNRLSKMAVRFAALIRWNYTTRKTSINKYGSKE